MFSAIASIFGGERANAANAKIARKNREFQERMSNTAYQRQRKDMELAGINPILAYKTGGSSSPGGSMARMENTLKAGADAHAASRGASAKGKTARSQELGTALQARKLSQELANMKAAEGKDKAAGLKDHSQAEINTVAYANQQKQGRILDQAHAIGKSDVEESRQRLHWMEGSGGGIARELGRYFESLGLKARVPWRKR